MIHASATVHETAIVDPAAVIGPNCYIGPFCHIGAHVTLGRDNRLESHVSLGARPEHRLFAESGHKPLPVVIGDNNRFWEFVTVNCGTVNATEIGSDCLFFKGSHVAHDVIVEDNVTVAGASIAGHCRIGRGATLAGGSVIHQRTLIGAYAMIGLNASVTRHVKPGEMVMVGPMRQGQDNMVGLERNDISETELELLRAEFDELLGRAEWTGRKVF